ncbi:Uma2 family endonuclease [Micromonospora thermarum]|uniref:Uma2 family endonuclease n=1 Tax=Micromonospora thermarum TaxID=2720024 RepID=UPI002814C087|nr:Uma2 family endonuclease [Micromonospora thermarum]
MTDLLHLPDESRYELIAGRLVMLDWTPVHQDLCLNLLLAVSEYCPGNLLPSLHVSVAVDRRHEFRPDVLVMRTSCADVSPLPVTEVVLAVEVLASHDRFHDLYDKAKVYAKAGVGSYWVIDPLQERIMLTEYALGSGREHEQVAHTEDLFVTERPWKVSVDLPALTARRNDLLATDAE